MSVTAATVEPAPAGLTAGPAPGDARRPTLLPLTVRGLRLEAGGKTLIHDIDFTLQAGPKTIILGPNGAGKSLLLRLCHGLIAQTDGQIDWAGRSPEAARRDQAMVFQRPVLLRRSAAGNIAFALSVKGIARRQRPALVKEALARAGLSALADRSARVLSGGEQQRLALARAAILEPQILLLDEPTSNLDPAATAAVEQLIAAIHAAGTKVIMTTHDLGQARRLADEVLFLHHGRLLEHTAAERFFRQPESSEASAFMQGKLLW